MAILGHEGGTQKFRVVAQNKAIQISFQMIFKKFPLITTNNSTTVLVEPHQNLGGPGLLNMIFSPHKDIRACKKSAWFDSV